MQIFLQKNVTKNNIDLQISQKSSNFVVVPWCVCQIRQIPRRRLVPIY